MASRWNLFLIMLWFGGCGTGEGAVESGCSEGVPLDSKGREFIFAIPSPFGKSRSIYPVVIVTSESAEMTLVNVSRPEGTIRHSVSIGPLESAVLNLTTDALVRGSRFDDNAVVVTATSDVSVRCLVEQQRNGFNSEGFTAIPTDALGRDYFVLTFDTHSTVVGGNDGDRYHSVFALTATVNRTLVSVELSAPAFFDGQQHLAGELFQFTLDRATSAQILSLDDLTGTKVTSSHPVALVAGNDCSDVLRLFNYCHYLVTQLPPVETWGRRFVLAHWGPKGSIHTWRILAPYYNTTLTFHDNHLTRVTPGIPRWYDYPMYDEKAVLLTADQAVLVVQYVAARKSSACVLSIPIEQYTDEASYMRASQSLGSFQSTAGTTGHVSMSSPLAIIYPCEGESDILINGLQLGSLPPSTADHFQDATGRYCVLEQWESVQRQDRWHVDSRRTNTRFSSVVLKFSRGAIVSAYPGAMLLEPQGCAPSASTTWRPTTTLDTNKQSVSPNEGGDGGKPLTDTNIVLIALCSVLSAVVMLIVSCYATSFACKRCRGKSSTGQVRMRYNVRTEAIEGARHRRRQAVESVYSNAPSILTSDDVETREPDRFALAPPDAERPVRLGTVRVRPALVDNHGEEPGIRANRMYADSINAGEGLKHTYMALH